MPHAPSSVRAGRPPGGSFTRSVTVVIALGHAAPRKKSFKGFVTTLRPPRPGGDCVGQKELLINKGLRVEQGCWQVVVQSPEGCEMRIHNCHPVATLKEITPCLSVSYSLYELPTTGLACRYLGISWPPFGLRCDCGRRRVGRMEEPATRWPPTKNPEEPNFVTSLVVLSGGHGRIKHAASTRRVGSHR